MAGPSRGPEFTKSDLLGNRWHNQIRSDWLGGQYLPRPNVRKGRTDNQDDGPNDRYVDAVLDGVHAGWTGRCRVGRDACKRQNGNGEGKAPPCKTQHCSDARRKLEEREPHETNHQNGDCREKWFNSNTVQGSAARSARPAHILLARQEP